jgi:hypothetical protein
MDHDEYISEGQAHSDNMEYWESKEALQMMMGIGVHHRKIIVRNDNLIKQALARYEDNTKAKVGDTICCPSCGKNFKKKSYQQKFHSTKCKDIYWNSVDDVRRERAKFYKDR